ncbi:MAG: hypothetical protein R2827_12610 [Bdellovibrionales bacterium]
MQKVIYGQDKAIEALVASIKMNRTGIGHEGKPTGSYLLQDLRVLEKQKFQNNSPKT